MAFVLLNSRIFAGAADLTGAANKSGLSSSFEDKDATNYGSGGWKDVLGGLADTQISAGGQWAAGDPGCVDDTLWDAVNGRRPIPWTFCPESANVGSLAWFTSALTSSYKLGDAVGEVAPWEASARGTEPLLRGVVAHPPGMPRAANGAGSWVNVGTLAGSQRLYAALHVLSVAGTAPALTVSVESAQDDAGTGSMERLTLPAVTAPGGRFASVAGPVTDQWWRVSWSIAGDSPSILFVAALGVA